MSAVLFAASAAHAVPPPNDNFANAFEVPLGTARGVTNVDATVQPDEALTPTNQSGPATCNGTARMDGTTWWYFTGNGEDLTVSTFGSDFDTVLAVYNGNGTLNSCNDNFGGTDPFHSELIIPNTQHEPYWVQVGGFCPTAAPCAQLRGTVIVSVFGAGTGGVKSPPNDDRANASLATDGIGRVDDNLDATLEGAAENRVCDGNGYGSTVWYRFTASSRGRVTITFSPQGTFGGDVILAAYTAIGTTPIACEGTDAGTFEKVTFDVSRGQSYLLQIGGSDLGGICAEGDFHYDVDFTSSPDQDGDGVNGSGGDCNDEDPSIRPGASELVNNEVDENCDRINEFDRDGDGARLPGGDCNDANAGIHPGAVEVLFNGVDDNCDTRPGAIPIVESDAQLNWSFKNRTRNRFITLVALDVEAERGARIAVTCKRGRRRVCKRQVRTARRLNARAALDFRTVRRLRARPGTTIEIRITKAGRVGRYFAWRTRKVTRGPRVTRCIDPRDGKLHRLRSCPTAFL